MQTQQYSNELKGVALELGRVQSAARSNSSGFMSLLHLCRSEMLLEPVCHLVPGLFKTA